MNLVACSDEVMMAAIRSDIGEVRTSTVLAIVSGIRLKRMRVRP